MDRQYHTRIADDVPELIPTVEYCCLRAQDLGYLDGHPISPDYPLYNENWGKVTVLRGLPGTGKDSFIGHNYPDLPVVSMDDIRNELDIKPTENQGMVVQAAIEQAKVFLRSHQPFVWNATNLTRMARARILGLCEEYKASARIIFIETPWKENLRRNAAREAIVPQAVIDRKLDKLEMPYPQEAEHIEWICL